MTIIITGASKGFGKVIAEKFLSDGKSHTLFLCARNESLLQSISDDMHFRFPLSTIYCSKCDISKKEDIKIFAHRILDFNRSIDVLVNNAGVFIPGSIYNEEEGLLEQLLQTNVLGAYHLTRALLPAMMAQHNGHIFNICSIASLQAYTNGGSYGISKFALAGFSKNLREEMKPFNIKVTSVYPGAAFTNSWSETGIDPKRIMEANDIATMIYAASRLSPQACVEDIVLRPQLGDV